MIKKLKNSKVAQNSTLLVGCDTAAKLVGLFTTILYARVMGPAVFGVFIFVFSTAQIFSVLPDMGLHRWSVQDLARNKRGGWDLLRTLFRLKLGLSFITMILGAIVALIVVNIRGQQEIFSLILLAIAAICVRGMTMNFLTLYHGYQQMKWPAIFNLVFRIATLIYVPLVAWETRNLFWVFLALLLIDVIDLLANSCVGVANYRSEEKRDEPPVFGKILKSALPFSLQSLATLFYFYIDSVMLYLMEGETVLGYYGAGYRLVLAALVIPSSFSAALFPALAERGGDKAFKLYLKALPLYLLMGFGFMAVCLPFADFWINLLFDKEDFAGTIPLFIILSFSFPLYCLTMSLGNYFGATHRQNWAMIIGIIMAIANLILNLIWIPQFHAMGAAMATVATEFMVLIAFGGLKLYSLFIRE